MGTLRGRSLVALAVVGLAAGATACGGIDDGQAAGRFTPGRPGVLTIATSLPAPGFWTGPADAPTGGFEHGLALALMERFDLERIEVIDVPFDRLVAGDLGGADLALAEITPTSDRDTVLDFTTGYLDANPAVIVRPSATVDDLAAARELTWVVQSGSTQATLVDEVVRPDEEPLRVGDIDAVVAAVRDGRADAGLLDLPTALVEQELTDDEVVVVAQFDTEDELAIAVPDGSDDLAALDSAVRALLADGTIDDLAARWLGRDATGTALDVPLIRARAAD